MRLRWAASRGDISRSIAIRASLVWAPARAWNTADTRSSAWPLRSRAAMVLAKLGASGQAAMASISAIWSAMARSKAGRKCSGRIAVNGGVSWGVVQASRRGLGVLSGNIGDRFHSLVFMTISRHKHIGAGLVISHFPGFEPAKIPEMPDGFAFPSIRLYEQRARPICRSYRLDP